MMDTQQKAAQLKPLAIALSALILTGCATFSKDGGLDTVSSLTKERTGQTVQRDKTEDDAAATQARVNQLLAQPLTPDSAIQIALANNKGLQAAFAELGVAEANRVQAGRLSNPGFSFGRQRGGEDVEIERSIMFNFVGLLTMPIRSNIEGRRFEQAKLQAASQAVQLAANTRKAYFNAVAAQQSAQYAEQVATAAEASADLAQRLAKVGNWSKLDQAREHAFHADATTQFARTRHNATAAREQLTRLLGLWGTNAAFKLPERLPDLPKAPNEVANLESQAMTQRLDVQVAQRDVSATASNLGLTQATGFINVFEAGYTNKSETGSPRANGYEIELVLPIFDWGGARTARAEATYMQSVQRTADTAVRARSEVREAYSAYRTTYEVAKHYRDEVVPLRKRISDEVLLRYNGMLASVFELLTDARTQVSSVNAAIEAQRDFWIAETNLQAAVNGSGTGGGSTQMTGQASGEADAPAH
ncbi:TolC family protein [Noviherbaspirillum suwonense]|uniref:Outer membrane protein TolC n=1 Tax=Noviherbaspirillum suwonense TaxID=1224511 RepID=A0ABY1PXV0_9BURK|nr:TolC family protein [Noviherbaspirillum suwonense]SMP52126.1 Outer membrane protein TolC [Noviherbaspirillum suwonense]